MSRVRCQCWKFSTQEVYAFHFYKSYEGQKSRIVSKCKKRIDLLLMQAQCSSEQPFPSIVFALTRLLLMASWTAGRSPNWTAPTNLLTESSSIFLPFYQSRRKLYLPTIKLDYLPKLKRIPMCMRYNANFLTEPDSYWQSLLWIGRRLWWS
jgi:hypothetical protein